MNIVNSLKKLYTSLGGNADTVKDVQTAPDMVDALADIAASTIELPAVDAEDNGKVLKVANGKWAKGTDNSLPEVTTEDAGDVLTVNAEGAWVKDNGLYGSGEETPLNTTGSTTSIPFSNITYKKSIKVVIDGVLSATSGAISINDTINISPNSTNSKFVIDITRISNDSFILSCGDKGYVASISSIAAGIAIKTYAINFTSGKATVYMK